MKSAFFCKINVYLHFNPESCIAAAFRVFYTVLTKEKEDKQMKDILEMIKSAVQMLFAVLLILAGAVIRDPFLEEEVASVAATEQETGEKVE